MLKFKRLFSVLLAAILMLSSVSALAVNAQTEDTPSEVLQNISVTDEAEDVIYATADEAVIPEATEDEKELPSYVDNSLSKYFPEIVNNYTICEGEGVIAPAVLAAVYYQFTYEMNKLRDVETTFENSFSPEFAYDFLYYGIDRPSRLKAFPPVLGNVVFSTRRELIDNVDAILETYNFLMNVGCTTIDNWNYDPEYGHDTGNSDITDWPSSASAWRDAYRYRLDSFYTFPEIGDEDTAITSPDDTDLTQIKEALSNGSVLVFDTSCEWNTYRSEIETHEDAPENEKFVGMEYIKSKNLYSVEELDTKVLVGYNDDIWCDINKNGAVDSGEMGAFKVIETFDSNRSYWIAYDALNETSVVENMESSQYRIKLMRNVYGITVKAPEEDKGIYVKFTLDDGRYSRFAVTFTAEGNGEKYEKRFLPGIDYFAYDTRWYGFDNDEFAFLLSDLIPDLTADNFDDYEIHMTVEDMVEERDELTLKEVVLVNEFTGEESVILDGKEKIMLDNSKYTVKVSGSLFVYYFGYDEPVMYYKTDGGEFVGVPMKYTTEQEGYLYKYSLADTSEALVYFADANGNIDDNNGEYFKAVAGFNYYTTEVLKDALTINEFAVSNGLPEISSGKKTMYDVSFSGGYAPYKYRYIYKDLETGTESKTAFRTCDENTVFEKRWFDEYNALEVTLEIKDYLGNIASKSITLEVKDRPFEISVVTNNDKGVYYLSDSAEFRIDTNYYMYMNYTKNYAPRLKCVVKDSDGNLVFIDYYRDCVEYNYDDKTSTTYLSFKPEKAGEYTLTVSATDDSGEYAEKTVDFVFYDNIIGDANGDGIVNIKDATEIQKCLAGMTSEEMLGVLTDCDGDGEITIKDATAIQKYIVGYESCADAGKAIEYVRETYTVKFENLVGWENVYCEMFSYYADDDSVFPGTAMTICETDENGNNVYSVEVPYGVYVLSFNNGIDEETLRIDFDGCDTHYRPIDEGVALYKVEVK